MRTGFIILMLTTFTVAYAQQKVKAVGPGKNEITLMHRAQQALTDVIVHDVFSPPVASRIYLYANLSAYEVLALENNRINSFANYREMPSIPKAGKDVYLPLAALAAFFNTSFQLIFSEQRLADSANLFYKEFRKQVPDAKRFNASIAFGKQVSDSILKLAYRDNYKETRSMRRYSVTSASGRWIPTPPGYMAAIEPHWGKMRPFMLDSAAQFRPPVPFEYDDATGSFHKQALEVYEAVKNLTKEQRDISLFWDCNPFFLNTNGHLMFATKKLSPGGHWMSIAAIASKKTGADIYTTVKAYTFTAIALYDGFISCWDEKYRSVYIRPETYINSKIDESWRPLLQTPPFPEYTSGHSVISNAAAAVLQSIFGDDVLIEDNSEVPYGLPVRSFPSFQAAAEEAAISRLYGGIHFRQAIENGQVQGRHIGEFISNRLSGKNSRVDTE